MNEIVLNHPLITHKLAILRDINTGTKEFRELVTEISILLCYEAMKDAKLEKATIEILVFIVMRKLWNLLNIIIKCLKALQIGKF